MRVLFRFSFLLTASLAACAALPAAPPPAPPPILGRWDMTVHESWGSFPSWLEVQQSGHETLVGYFVGGGGSVRPISRVTFRNGRVRFALPPQWEGGKRDLVFEGTLAGGALSGWHTTAEGKRARWSAVRAPALKRRGEPRWGEPVELFNGRDLSGWKPRNPRAPNGWSVQYGLLRNRKPGNDLVTTGRWMDFRLHAEFRYPRGSNSGIYLRGRYEVQVQDDYGREPESHGLAGIYGFLAPRENRARRAGEWQEMDVTLVGRRVTVALNGETVIDRQEIPGITGGALDSREGQPGPTMLQGDHGPIDFRKLTLTPARPGP